MILRYQGVFYKYTQLPLTEEMVGRQIQRSRHLQPKTISPSVQVLRDRGAFYLLQEMRSPNLRSPSLEVVHLPNNSKQSHTSNGRFVMHIQRMGSLYKLYCLGWRNGSLKCLSPLQHWLLSIFLHYRRGFAEGYKWKQNQMKS